MRRREGIDLNWTPLKDKKPPWLKMVHKPMDLTKDVESESKKWFSSMVDDSSSSVGFVNSAKMNRIKEVEKRIQKRFPKCQPMFGEMVEFIAQSISDQLLQPNFHPKNLLANEYATALPFAHFSNLIYSKELLIQFAS